MRRMADIEVILDDSYTDPKITIRTKSRTPQIESIITAVEEVAESAYPMIQGENNGNVELISQRDIMRIYTEGRKVVIRTEEVLYSSGKTLLALEEVLNPDRFLRISQSEIINFHKVKCFDFNISGTIGILFDNGERTWVARSRMKAIKAMIRENT